MNLSSFLTFLVNSGDIPLHFNIIFVTCIVNDSSNLINIPNEPIVAILQRCYSSNSIRQNTHDQIFTSLKIHTFDHSKWLNLSKNDILHFNKVIVIFYASNLSEANVFLGDFLTSPELLFQYVIIIEFHYNYATAADFIVNENANGKRTSLHITDNILREKIPSLKNFGINSHLYFCFEEVGNEDIESSNNNVFEVYSVGRNRKLIVKQINYFEDGKYKYMWWNSWSTRRRDFQQAEIIVGHTKKWSLSTNSGMATATNKLRQSSTYHIIGYVQDFLNFSVKIHGAGSFNNVTEELKGKKIDFGLSATGMIPSVSKEFRFVTTPTYTDFIRAYYSPPEPAQQWTIHFKVFSLKAWIAIWAILIVLFLTHSLLKTKNSYWWAISYCAYEAELAQRNSVHLVRNVGFLMAVTLYGIYSGGFISSLSLLKEPPMTIHRMIEMGYKFGLKNDTYLYAALQARDFNETTSAWKMYSNLHPTMGTHINMSSGIYYALKDPKFVFIAEKDMHEFISKDEINDEQLCKRFKELPIAEYTMLQSSIVRKNHPDVNYFNLAGTYMREVGLWHVHRRRRDVYQDNLEPNCDIWKEKFHPFQFKEVLLPFLVVACGLVVSPLVLCLERNQIFFHPMSNRNHNLAGQFK